MAAQELGLEEVPVMVARSWSEKQKRAYVLADNKLAENAGWDSKMLALELGDLRGMGVDLALIGFSKSEVSNMTGGGGKTDPDEVPPPPAVPVTEPGDIWLLGDHRIICGDSTDAATVERLLAGAAPHLMVTDPPYGVEYDPDWRNRADRANGKAYGASAVGTVENDDRADWSDAYLLFPGDVAYVWHPAGALGLVFGSTLQACGFDIRMVVIWAKQQFPIGRGHYHVQHEPCYYAIRKKAGATGHWNGDRKQTTLWQIDKPRKSETGHSTQKPVECMKRPIENNSRPGDAVYEPFSGSGTTIIAAEMTGRRCYAIELSTAYVDVAVKRWQAFTGKDAVHEDGATFSEMSDRRYNPDQNSKGSHDEAIKAIRENLNAAKRPKAKTHPPQAGNGKPRKAKAQRQRADA